MAIKRYENNPYYWLFGLKFTHNELEYSEWEVQIELGPIGTFVFWKGMEDE